MPTKQHGLLAVIAIVFAACNSAATRVQPEPTLPPPAVATQSPTTAPQIIELSPTASAAAEPPPAPTEASTEAPPQPVIQILSGAFVKMEVPVAGAFTLDPSAGLIRFSADFRVDPGPDLYVILSSANNLALDFVTFSRTVVDAPILYLGVLANTDGAQTYTLPAGTGLEQFNTIVVWCKTYSVAFAAAPLR